MFNELLSKISNSLQKHNITYMVIGGQAVLIYGEARLTNDIDITLGVSIEELPKMLIIISQLKLNILVDNVENFVKKTMVLPVKDVKSGIRIDFIFSFSSYERQAIKRAKSIKFGKSAVKFASLEDIVVHKIIAGRTRDIEDIKSIILKHPKYDQKYILKCLKEFDALQTEKYSSLFKRIVKEIKEY